MRNNNIICLNGGIDFKKYSSDEYIKIEENV